MLATSGSQKQQGAFVHLAVHSLPLVIDMAMAVTPSLKACAAAINRRVLLHLSGMRPF